MNPLFSDDETNPSEKDGYILPNSQRRVEPLPANKASSPAVELIRRKVEALYASEPDAKEEIKEVAAPLAHHSKHQAFMYDLSTSGTSLAHIQTEWHNYYTKLPDHEKHQVWQEFYDANQRHPSNYSKFVGRHTPSHQPAGTPPPTMPLHDEQAAAKAQVFVNERLDELPASTSPIKSGKLRSVADIKKHVLKKVRTRSAAQIKAKKHVQSLLFGLSLGALSVLIFLFGFFNEVVIAPFIQPSGKASATPIILSADGIAPSTSPELIIPKINVQLPIIYGLESADEASVQKGLESGIIHYPSTGLPGQQGNAAYFGHSSNNIFNKGKYKFAFVLLHELAPGDIFYLTHEGKVYSYKVFQKKVVDPNETWVLNPVEGKVATAALITCDPPGTSRHRLVVWGEQISPDPLGNAAPTQPEQPAQTEELPSEGPSAWTRFWRWVTPW